MLKVTCAIIVHYRKILITQRGENSDHPFKWEFPGGKIALDESPEDCIKREIREELKFEIDILQKMQPVNFDYGFKQIKLIPFLCSYKNGKITLIEHHDFKWIGFNELKTIKFSEADSEMIKLEANRTILKEYFGKHVDKS